MDAWAHMEPRIRMKKQDAVLNLRSHSIDKLNHYTMYDRRILLQQKWLHGQ